MGSDSRKTQCMKYTARARARVCVFVCVSRLSELPSRHRVRHDEDSGQARLSSRVKRQLCFGTQWIIDCYQKPETSTFVLWFKAQTTLFVRPEGCQKQRGI